LIGQILFSVRSVSPAIGRPRTDRLRAERPEAGAAVARSLSAPPEPSPGRLTEATGQSRRQLEPKASSAQ
jgi:hypothetical protein